MHQERPGDGELPLEVAYCGGRALKRPGMAEPQILPHFHDEVEILAVFEGTVRCTVGDADFCCRAGDIAVVNPGALHLISADRDADFACVRFRYDRMESKLPDGCHTKYVAPFQKGEYRLPVIADGEARAQLFAEARFILDTYAGQRPGYELQLKASLYKLLAAFVENGLFIKDNVYTGKFVLEIDSPLYRVLDFMNTHFRQKIALNQLAEMANLNKNYFCEYFKSKMKYTPVQYLNILRINEAKKLIDASDRKLIDIAYETGFNNFSYFTQTFHSIMGVLPSEYKKSRKQSVADSRHFIGSLY